MIGRAKGFTLIELLVVIAIIGVLSSVVLAALSNARGKGTDAKVKSQLSSARAKAEIFNDANNSSYNGPAGNISGPCTTANSMFTDVNSGMSVQLAAVNYPGSTLTCYSTAGAYAISATLPGAGGTNSWCVESTGASKSRTTAINSTAC
jgi:prepilin-type N-terminal cleavage/methylation domain-containing protein